MKKRNLLLIVLSGLLLISILVGSTIAYFSDNKEDNTKICIGNVDILLTEHEILYIEGLNQWSLGSNLVFKNDYKNIYPDILLPKDPTVENIGDEPEYVAFSYKMSKDDFENLFLNYTPETCFYKLDSHSWTVKIESQNDEVIIYFAFKKILWPKENATPFKGIKISKNFTYQEGKENLKIDQKAYAVQARGFAKDISVYDEKERDMALRQCIKNWGV